MRMKVGALILILAGLAACSDPSDRVIAAKERDKDIVIKVGDYRWKKTRTGWVGFQSGSTIRVRPIDREGFQAVENFVASGENSGW